ncbi:G-protein coupled receptor 22 isoform X1 [Arvicanthis niloticus]|uniref:G-protein coupled receptor 22 isoform X1 n=2 Tax=Arvicanthis niloticus TaxID=61156 RepID=UPI00148627F3|nr:G-protein coupled receptor 22 isoform X1 [Arvicanthis niloticus]
MVSQKAHKATSHRGNTNCSKRMCFSPVLEINMQSESNVTVRDDIDDIDTNMYQPLSYPLSFQVSLTGFLMLEIVLGLGSNLTVLVLYCMKSNLINSVSNIITMNLHVLDVIICVGCIPLTIVILLLSLESNTALICCFHEACVSFASVSTAINVFAITLDRYDISVKPANRILTMGRAVMLMTSIWIFSFFSFLIPFIEVNFFSLQSGNTWENKTLLCVSTSEYYTELGMYYHLLVQIPIFFFTVIVMLITYTKILQALNIRIGTRFSTGQKKKARKKKTISLATHETTDMSQSSGGRNVVFGVRTSVSVIIALRRAVKRHRERRERQKRVFKMSLLIISTFLLCWTPISVLNTTILCLGPSDLLVKLRLCFLVMAYGTTIFHPLLYAFTRQKFQKVLKSKMKKRVVSIVEADPMPNNAVIHNSWIDPKRNKKVTYEDSEIREKCLVPQVVTD